MADLIVPQVHMNGTSQRELLRQFMDAHTALEEALDALRKTAPNGRDYYVTGNFSEAQLAHIRRMTKIEEVSDEVEKIAEAIANQE